MVLGRTVLFLSVLFSGLVFAAACAEKAYSATCDKCSFDSDGRLDQKCYEGYQNNGVSCLFAAYPLESINYQMNGCPAVDTCRQRLEVCKAIFSSGSDKDDCSYGDIDHCFINADRCVDAAIKNCNEEPPGEIEGLLPSEGWCDGFFFLFIPLFAGAIFLRRE